MRDAIQLAIENVKMNLGGPFAAVLVRDNAILSSGVNRVTSALDPTAHAEITAIRNACRIVGSHELRGVTLYATCEPCPMCLGAIYWARIERVFFASNRVDAANAGFDDALIYEELSLNPGARSIEMNELLRDEAKGIFDAWRASEDRIPY